MDNLIITLAKKYKKNDDFIKVINDEIRNEIKLLNNKHSYKFTLLKGETYIYKNQTFTNNSTYYFNPYSIFYYLNNKHYISVAIERALKNLNIEYKTLIESRVSIPNRFNVITNNLESLDENLNLKIWKFSKCLIEPKEKKINRLIKKLIKYKNHSKTHNKNKFISIFELSYMMYFSQPKIFFPIDKAVIKKLDDYSNTLLKIKENDEIINYKRYINFCLSKDNNLKIKSFIDFSKNVDFNFKISNKNKENILKFLNDYKFKELPKIENININII